MYNPNTTGRPLAKQRTASTAGVPEAFAGGSYGPGSAAGASAGGTAAYGTAGAYPSGGAAGARAPAIDESLQCYPRFMQLTTQALPSTAVAVSKSAIPLAVTVHPLAEEPGEPKLPLVNFGTAGVVRCGRCRAYIHPFVNFINGGRQWRCSMCGKLNDVPSVYYCPLDEQGRRTDLADHPELTRGSVEVVAPAEYMVRPPQAPVYMFVIDVSHQAVESGMLENAVAAIKKCITEELLPGGERTQIGFITFDSAVHFYNLKASLASAQMLVVSDITDLFLPIPDELLVNLSDSRSVVEALLDSLPEMFSNTRNVESAMGPAVEAAYKVMRHIGGKMVVMQSSLPSLGAGRLRHRENPKMLGGELEHTLLAAGSPYVVLGSAGWMEFRGGMWGPDQRPFWPCREQAGTTRTSRWSSASSRSPWTCSSRARPTPTWPRCPSCRATQPARRTTTPASTRPWTVRGCRPTLFAT